MSLLEFRGILFVVLMLAGLRAFSAKRAAAGIFAVAVTGLYLGASPGSFVVLGTILLLLVLSTPLFVTLGILSLVSFYFLTDEYRTLQSYELLIEKIFGLTDKNVLLAIPYFVVAGSVMTAGGIARRLVQFADALVGWLPGGLAAAAVLSCMFFAAISGSSPVTVIAIGSIMMPALVKGGYDERFSLGLVTTAGSLGILIPPSIPMIVYAIMVSGTMSVDVADLFLAGIGPGLVIGGLLIGYSVWHGVTRPGFAWSKLQPPSLARIRTTFLDGFWALMLPILILGGIYPIFGPRGLFTPTEAAAVAVVYAFVVELFIHKEMSWKKVPGLLVESTVMMGALLVILVISFALNHFLVEQEIPDAAVTWMTSLDLDLVGFLLLLNVFLLLIGCLMDIMSAIMIVAPLVAPIAESFGISAVHLGIIFVVNLEIGYLTPPIGLNLFVSATLFDKPIGAVMRSVLPFITLMLFGLALITWFEPASVGLVRVLQGRNFLDSPPRLEKPKSKTPAVVDDDDDDDDEAETPPAPGVKSIEELMRDAAGGGAAPADDDDDDDDDAAPSGGVKSIEELMREAAGKKADAPPEAAPSEAAPSEAAPSEAPPSEAQTPADEADDDDDEPAPSGGVKSIEQLMREAAEKR